MGMARKACGWLTRRKWHARHVWNAGVVQYKVQCEHAGSSKWNVWYAWNAGVVQYKVQCGCA